MANSIRKAVTARCIVSRRLHDGPAFAVREDTGEKVYINYGAANRHDLGVLDVFEAILLPNIVEPEKTPFFCVSLRLESRGGEA